jgi:hypothetical protein
VARGWLEAGSSESARRRQDHMVGVLPQRPQTRDQRDADISWIYQAAKPRRTATAVRELIKVIPAALFEDLRMKQPGSRTAELKSAVRGSIYSVRSLLLPQPCARIANETAEAVCRVCRPTPAGR